MLLLPCYFLYCYYPSIAHLYCMLSVLPITTCPIFFLLRNMTSGLTMKYVYAIFVCASIVGESSWVCDPLARGYRLQVNIRTTECGRTFLLLRRNDGQLSLKRINLSYFNLDQNGDCWILFLSGYVQWYWLLLFLGSYCRFHLCHKALGGRVNFRSFVWQSIFCQYW